MHHEHTGRSLDFRVLHQARVWSAQQPVWLATVLSTWGSAPRAPGAMLACTENGHFVGSLSGGCVEDHFLSSLSGGQWRQPSQIVRYGAGDPETGIRLPCGGTLDILIEYLPPGPMSVGYFDQMLQALTGHRPVCKIVRLPEACSGLQPTTFAGRTRVTVALPDIEILLSAAPRLLVAGYSPVAHYCMTFALSLGFEVVLCEPREEILSTIDFDGFSEVILRREFPAKVLEKENCHPHTAIVALTHDARMDDLTMMEAVNTPAFYLGVMGSEKNSKSRRERLQRIGGLDSEQLSRIHAPIGLPIGSKTPAEIALAIMADIVRVKNISCSEADLHL
ncbi:XshC-Cox1 family protein [Tatumella morbirosei]|uniref:XshC-Cox1 family protein n=1 Tax=Tatumella morbirosei TaxID=642227 RepID=A0A0F5BUY0_9GAMM|nr:XshC-Cox1 family protein [Tatumella morbirosei]